MGVLTSAAAVLILTILYWLYQYIAWIYQIWFVIGKAVNKFPGDPVKWPYGNVHQIPPFNEERIPYQKRLAAKYPRVWRTWIGPFVPLITLCHPETVKILTQTEEPKFTSGRPAYAMALPWLGEGLLISKGQKWKRNRRLLTPAFHFDILKSYIAVYNEEVEMLMNKWMKKSATGDSFDIQGDISSCTLGTILRCAFSYEKNVQDAGNHHPYVTAVFDMSRIISKKAFSPLHRMSDLFSRWSPSGQKFLSYCDYVHEVADNVITKRQQTLRDDPNALLNKKYLDFLDILLQAKDEDGSGLTDLEIRNEVDTFLFEGHDTTASGISWTLYSLAKNPKFQKKAQEEIDELLVSRTNKCIMWEDLSRLPYLTQCIKESFRILPPVSNIGRQITKPLTIDGVTVPPHTYFNINILALHHNPEVWGEDHDEYKPDRFHPDNIAKIDNFAYMPFSAGPRNCIGQNFALNELKVIIARILHRFSLSLDEDHPIAPRPELIIRAMHGIKVFAAPR